MPVLEDTVDFKVATLNDLLDADVRTGVPVAADDKYKRWAFLSSGLAGMLFIALIVSLVTGGGGDSSGETISTDEFPKPAGTRAVSAKAGTADLEGIEPGSKVTIYSDEEGGKILANGATVLKITQQKTTFGITKTVRVAVTEQEVQAVTTAEKVIIVEGETPTTTTATTAPASTVPTPIEPAPATTPSS